MTKEEQEDVIMMVTAVCLSLQFHPLNLGCLWVGVCVWGGRGCVYDDDDGGGCCGGDELSYSFIFLFFLDLFESHKHTECGCCLECQPASGDANGSRMDSQTCQGMVSMTKPCNT
jgi:hypothetical protein